MHASRRRRGPRTHAGQAPPSACGGHAPRWDCARPCGTTSGFRCTSRNSCCSGSTSIPRSVAGSAPRTAAAVWATPRCWESGFPIARVAFASCWGRWACRSTWASCPHPAATEPWPRCGRACAASSAWSTRGTWSCGWSPRRRRARRSAARRRWRAARGWARRAAPLMPTDGCVGVLLRQAERLVGKRYADIAQAIPPELLARWESS